jgi:hypothetical protein
MQMSNYWYEQALFYCLQTDELREISLQINRQQRKLQDLKMSFSETNEEGLRKMVRNFFERMHLKKFKELYKLYSNLPELDAGRNFELKERSFRTNLEP